MTMDNISELLEMIVEFTEKRQKVLTRNINCVHDPGFVPRDLALDEFADLLNTAIEEHLCHHRLVLCDTDNITFEIGGGFNVKAIVDIGAIELLEKCRDDYIEGQVNKLLENALNQRVAAELLRERQAAVPLVQ
ncbi:MAG: hypothetical protein JW720_04460 [Sedimentisphaerales bacterium]|nr:hypothetical protein [Sedimentisphaerales bacterium]